MSKRHINLLPRTCQARRIVGRCLLPWVTIWVLVAGVAVGFFYWTEYASYRTSLQKLDACRRQHAPIVKRKTEIDRMRAQIEELRSRESLALQLAGELPDVTLLGIVSRATRQSRGAICVEELTFHRKREPSQTSNSGGSARPGVARTLNLRGMGTDTLCVARFVARLRDSGLFDAVELKSTTTAKLGKKDILRYNLECTL